jgi:hypothetical protein
MTGGRAEGLHGGAGATRHRASMTAGAIGC